MFTFMWGMVHLLFRQDFYLVHTATWKRVERKSCFYTKLPSCLITAWVSLEANHVRLISVNFPLISNLSWAFWDCRVHIFLSTGGNWIKPLKRNKTFRFSQLSSLIIGKLVGNLELLGLLATFSPFTSSFSLSKEQTNEKFCSNK